MTERNYPQRIETNLNTALRFQFNCTCFQRGKASANFGKM